MNSIQSKALRLIVSLTILFGIALSEFSQASEDLGRFSSVIKASQSNDPADTFSKGSSDELLAWEVLFLDDPDDDSLFLITRQYRSFIEPTFFEIAKTEQTQEVQAQPLSKSHQARSPPAFI